MAEPQQETWHKLAILTVIILATAAGASAFKAIGFATRAQLAAAREARQWQDYQAESVRKDNLGLHRDILATLGVDGKAAKGHKSTTTRIKAYEDEMGRLNQERDQIKKVAQTLATQEEEWSRRAGDLSLAAILFQLAIMTSATGALTRKKILWLAGLVLGGWGLFNLVKGLWL